MLAPLPLLLLATQSHLHQLEEVCLPSHWCQLLLVPRVLLLPVLLLLQASVGA